MLRNQKKDHRNDPKFSDRQVWSNSVDLDQIAPGTASSGSTMCAIQYASFGLMNYVW